MITPMALLVLIEIYYYFILFLSLLRYCIITIILDFIAFFRHTPATMHIIEIDSLLNRQITYLLK